MPQTEDEHTKRFYFCVDTVVVIMLENDRYLKSKRSKELSEIVAEQLKCSKRTAQRYIKEARAEINRIGKDKKEKSLTKAIRDREYLLTKTKTSDLKLALEIMEDRDKLLGLYVEKVEHSGKVSFEQIDFKKYSKEQLKRLAEAKSEEEVLRLISEFDISKN